jgi:hypothetical protein
LICSFAKEGVGDHGLGGQLVLLLQRPLALQAPGGHLERRLAGGLQQLVVRDDFHHQAVLLRSLGVDRLRREDHFNPLLQAD